MNKPTIELNDQFRRALQLMEETGRHLFITGKAGSGKSTLLEYFRGVTKKRLVVLAPTGVAALNVKGETIHSFFNFKPDITVEKIRKLRGKKARIYREIDAVVIDEVSMVRADVLDCVDHFLRLHGRDATAAFGGCQMIFIGDLYQLPPVVTTKERELFSVRYKSPYFFSSRVCENLALEFVELEKIYRQKDQDFIDILNAIRNNTADDAHLAVLNERVGAPVAAGEGYCVHLTTTNRMAEAINEEHLQRLQGNIHTFDADISGNFEGRNNPTQEHLQLAEGAQVMLLNNDGQGRWVNGAIGRIARIVSGRGAENDLILVELENGRVEEVQAFSWELFHFYWNEAERHIESESIGSFTQYPLKLAWAITIHKSQGKTFERVVIDMGLGAFATGQTYVALSRCTKLAGITLVRPIRKSHVLTDWRIVDYVTKCQYALAEREMPLATKTALIEQAISAGSCLEIRYLKNSDEKSRRVIKPLRVGWMKYNELRFLGVQAHCFARNQERVFRIDRILTLAQSKIPEETQKKIP